MNILINDTAVIAGENETLIEAARRAGVDIPSLCYARGAVHKSSCMICAVKDCRTGQIIPACTTIPSEGMQIDTRCEEVILSRTLSLELLLSDHRADCEAPCSIVCPHGLDVERMLAFYDEDKTEQAHQTIAAAFPLPEIKCNSCKAPCEKACRRGSIDKHVAIRSIIAEICSRSDSAKPSANGTDLPAPAKSQFLSRLGRFTEAERIRIKESLAGGSRCLHCACGGRNGCKLRLYAGQMGIKRSRYDAASASQVMIRQKIADKLWFEPAKCIKCGLCVYNSTNGFTFKGRGFVMQIVLPEENRQNVDRSFAQLCPSGAIYLSDNPEKIYEQ
ncbi:MAG: (2Fe-2S)-binding protein [Tannerellaceae bacterium]|jgi:predicted molibdopterin-dependent oxidoreductase YjgC|nr:(2Fe-2S)-binding protein [Tannerellaceae bacterium]